MAIAFIPNTGNAGDGLIAETARRLFDQGAIMLPSLPFVFTANTGNAESSLINEVARRSFAGGAVSWEEYDPIAVRAGKLPERLPPVAVFGGGGGLVDPYTEALEIVEQLCKRFFQVIVLPHGIHGADDGPIAKFLRTAPAHLTIYARDPHSFEFASKHATLATIKQEHDLSFAFDYTPYQGMATVEAPLDCFRTDRWEQHAKQHVDDARNVDLSTICGPCDDPTPFLLEISKYKEIHTDRLHVAIASLMMGNRVELYPGAYRKNRDMYLHELRPRFSDRVSWKDWE